jgi:hypothetical protein
MIRTLPDNHPHKLVAVKIQKSASQYTDAALDEIQLLKVSYHYLRNAISDASEWLDCYC